MPLKVFMFQIYPGVSAKMKWKKNPSTIWFGPLVSKIKKREGWWFSSGQINKPHHQQLTFSQCLTCVIGALKCEPIESSQQAKLTFLIYDGVTQAKKACPRPHKQEVSVCL
jgi:hypothetical protein